MGLETGTFIDDLVATNPIATDLKSVGDDHLRLIKSVLRNTFPSAPKAFYFPTAVAKTASFSVLGSEMNKTFFIDTTSGAVVATLPALVGGDAGWCCHFVKFSGATTPYFVAPPSGSIISGENTSGVTRTRRSIIGMRVTAYWSSGAWFITRAIGIPIGSTIQTSYSVLTPGYEWPNGQTLASASTNYPDYFAYFGSGVTVDKRGRVTAGKDDMGGSSANRLTSPINGDILGTAGGLESTTILQGNLPNVNFTVDIPSGQGSHVHNVPRLAGTTSFAATAGAGINAVPKDTTTNYNTDSATLPQMSGTAASGGSDVAINNVQPTIVQNELLVVE